MQGTSVWFAAMAVVSVLAFIIGCRLGKNQAWRAWMWGGIFLLMLLVWLWLHHHPAIGVHLFGAALLGKIEGIGGVPIFMLLVGVGWSLSRLPRQKRVTALAVILGAVFFLNGGLWMLQTTPAHSFGNTIRGGMVMQSQDYSCVPAACATALHILGIPSSESQMAELTLTRPGTGATLVRAMAGLEQRLAGTRWKVQLIQANYRQLIDMPMPAITPLQFKTTQAHMVVILRVSESFVYLADPFDGKVVMDRAEFDRYYTGQILVFERSH